MKLISKAADGLLVAKAALAATVRRTAVRMLTHFCRFLSTASTIQG